ncbi:MAG: two-component regulator propeller domain-containing protein, partial [Terriglobus sp.]
MAQSPSTPLRLAEYQKQEWHVEDGLPESNVRMIVQRQDGNLLLATFSGVSIFDGQGFQRLKMPNAATSNIDAVNAVLPDRHGDLWIGTDGAGVLHQTATESVNISTAAGHQNERIRTMTLDQSGTLWIATQNGIERYRDGHMETIPDVGIIGGDITTVFADDMRGGMYFVTSSGVFHWNHGVTRPVTVPAMLGAPTALYRDRQHKLWIGTMHGLLEVTAEINTHEVQAVPRVTIPTQVTILVSDYENNLWIGTKGSGLWRWNTEGASSWTTKDGLADDTVRTLCVDDEDNLWIGGLSGGLARWRNAPFAPLVDPGFNPGYSAAVFGDSRGDLWLGTWGQGLFRRHNGTIAHVDLPGMRNSTGIRAITEDIHHNVWIGTWFDGLYRFDGTRWTHHTVGLESLVNSVSVLHADPKGGLWVGTYTGLLYFPDGIPAPQKSVAILPSKLVTDLLEDTDHSMLVATSTG